MNNTTDDTAPSGGGGIVLPVHLRLPMLDLGGARALLGLHEERIKVQIELGALIAWDIARAGAARRQYRLLAASACVWPEPRAMPEAELILRVYGPAPAAPVRRFAWLWGAEFSRAWNCDCAHTVNLVRDGVLKLMPKTGYGRGRGGSPRITWASAIEFLRARRL